MTLINKIKKINEKTFLFNVLTPKTIKNSIWFIITTKAGEIMRIKRKKTNGFEYSIFGIDLFIKFIINEIKKLLI